MHRRRVALVLSAVALVASGGVAQAPATSACTIPCNVSPKAMGVILGGGIPADSFGFTFYAKLDGIYNGNLVTNKQVRISGGGYYPAYGTVQVGSDYFDASVQMTVIPGLTGVPSLAIVEIARGALSTRDITGYAIGLLNGTNNVGALRIA